MRHIPARQDLQIAGIVLSYVAVGALLVACLVGCVLSFVL